MKLFLNLICILLVTVSFAADELLNYSSPFPIKGAVAFGDGLFMATGGGLRYKTNNADDMYTTANGLGDQSISAIAISDRGSFAVTDNGIVAVIGTNGYWNILTRSYAGSGLRVIPDMMRLAGPIIIIAFEDRLSFFDMNSLESVLTIERIADMNMSINAVSAMEVRDDSLYVAIDSNLYVRKMDWENLKSDVQLNNPDSWKLVKSVSKKNLIKSIAWEKNEIKTFPTEGTRIWDDDGETYVAADTFSVISSGVPRVVLRGNTLKDSILYERDSFVVSATAKDTVWSRYYRSKVRWVSLLPSNKAVLAGPNNVFYYDGKKVKDISAYERFALGSAYELQVLPDGGVLAASEEGKLSYNNGYDWSEPTKTYESFGNLTNARAHDLKVLSVIPGGVAFYHIWGYGSMLYQDWGKKVYQALLPDNDNCMDDYFENDEPRQVYTVSSAPSPDGKGFFLTSASNNGYSLVFMDAEDGHVSCANNIGSAPIASSIIVQEKENGDWVAYVGTRSDMSLSVGGGLDVITFPRPSSTGGELSSKITKANVKTYYGPSTTPLDMVYEPKTGYFWIVTETALEYWNEDLDSLRSPLSTNGLTSANYTSIDADCRGNLWVGTSSGAYRLTPRTTNPDTLSVVRFTTRNGLLSDRIQDMAVDTVLGFVWMAHENGITRYRRNDLRSSDGNMTDDAREGVKVFPNPFRPMYHPNIVFDNVTDDAVINIYNRGGKLVKSLRGEVVTGSRVEWDGRMDNGTLVAPGVYQYVIRGASKVKKGKLLVIH